MPITNQTDYHLQAQRCTLKIGGESGQGINSIGEIMGKTLKNAGWHVFGYREYPSLIKGGYSSYQLEIAGEPVRSPSVGCDLLVCLSRLSLHTYLPSVRQNGLILHSVNRMLFSPDEDAFIKQNKIEVAYIPADVEARQKFGKFILANTIMTGALAQTVGLPLATVEATLLAQFADKPKLLENNKTCLQIGHELATQAGLNRTLTIPTNNALAQQYLLTGNHALGLGAVAAGVRAYYAYPMTPSSSILTYLADTYRETGMLVRQVEDEISVAQMALGSNAMGTRALIATSGGGFDLMTESLSMAGMTETPFVCIIGQRPGPATGLPTWTLASDLELAVYAGHGEYTRLVVAASDPESCHDLVQRGFNLAEQFQIPVLILTEKQIAESLFAIDELPEPLPIERNLVPETELASLKAADRFVVTADNGVSKRWLPGQSPVTYDSNSDEHLEDGSLTEDALPIKAMYDKRLRKEQALKKVLPEPVMYGPETADVTLGGWGSVKNTLLDALTLSQALPELPTFNYLHYEYLSPLRTDTLLNLIAKKQPLALVEQNALGQLGRLIKREIGYQFTNRILKYDGRPFFIEDVLGSLLNLKGQPAASAKGQS